MREDGGSGQGPASEGRARWGFLGAPAALLTLLLATALVAGCGSDSDSDTTTAERADCDADRLPGEGDLCGDGDDERAMQIVDAAREVAEADGLPAVVVGVWEDGEPIVTAAIGEALPDVPATRDLHFRLGNVTESFTTTLLLQLVDDGDVSLDDPVSNWFPDLPRADQVTVGMLASSTSGYADYVTNPKFEKAFDQDVFRQWKPEELVELGVSQEPLFPPGASWAFSDTNFVILGQILEQVAGEPVPEALQDRTLDPLGLDETEMALTPQIPSPVMHGYTTERGLDEEATFWNPSWATYTANMSSDLDDLGAWTEALGTGELLSDESHEAQVGPGNVGIGPLTEDRYFGLGITVAEEWITTNPQIPGYNGTIGYLPDQELAIVVYNTLGAESDPATQYATRIFLQLTQLLTPENVPPLTDRPRG